MSVRGSNEDARPPDRCPVCHDRGAQLARRTPLAGGAIHQCAACGGFFLFPPLRVEYHDSAWTGVRVAGYAVDVERGRRFAEAICGRIARALGRRPATVLEVGCGTGFLGPGFAAAGATYTGIDVDEASVTFARSQGLDVHAIAAEGLPGSPLAGRRFDLVLTSNVLEHVVDPVAAFAALRAATGGIAAVVVPNAEGLIPRLKANRLFRRLLQLYLGRRRHETAYTIDGQWHNIAYARRTLAHLCARVGFEVLELHSNRIDDPAFGFVQPPNESALYAIVARLAGRVDMNSELLLLAR